MAFEGLFRDPARAYKRLSRFFLAATILNILFCAGLSWVRQAKPERYLYLVPHAQGIWLVGETSYGMRAAERFGSWQECHSHLRARGLGLQPINFVSASQSESVAWERVVRGTDRAYYKIVWQGRSGRRGILHAPDSETAQRIVEYLRYQELKAGPLGFGLPLQKI